MSIKEELLVRAPTLCSLSLTVEVNIVVGDGIVCGWEGRTHIRIWRTETNSYPQLTIASDQSMRQTMFKRIRGSYIYVGKRKRPFRSSFDSCKYKAWGWREASMGERKENCRYGKPAAPAVYVLPLNVNMLYWFFSSLLFRLLTLFSDQAHRAQRWHSCTVRGGCVIL